jgi:5-formyltetrahydrofolate cyclo-ligase
MVLHASGFVRGRLPAICPESHDIPLDSVITER